MEPEFILSRTLCVPARLPTVEVKKTSFLLHQFARSPAVIREPWRPSYRAPKRSTYLPNSRFLLTEDQSRHLSARKRRQVTLGNTPFK